MIWLLLTAGRGPGECQVAVKALTVLLQAEAQASNVQARLHDAEAAPHGLMSSLLALDGDGADAFARSWEGTIRWTCPSPLRPGWGRKNWYIGSVRLAPPPPASQFRDSDLRFEACRASGPGGQHVNRTNSAVRVIHQPSGLTAAAQEERSQHRNKALAVARLWQLLENRDRAGARQAQRDRWSRHDALERGNEVRAYEGTEFRRVG